MVRLSKLEDNLCMHRFNETIKSTELNQHSYFVELVSRFLKTSSRHDCFTPLPPMLGNGHCVDLLKLYCAVKQKGGFDVVSEYKSWGEVGLQCGVENLSFGSAFKLIYAKYLSSFESWLVKLDKENAMERNLLMELENDYGVYVSKIDGSCNLKLEMSGISFMDLTIEDDENESKKFDQEKVMTGFLGKNEMSIDDVVKSTEKSVDFKEGLIEHDAEETMNVDFGVSKDVTSQKRKRDCFSELLRWMSNVAKDPTDPAIVMTAKRSRQVSYDNASNWKQALLTRKSLFLIKISTRSAAQSCCQKKQKTNPSLATSCQNEATPIPPKQRSKTRPEIQQRLSTRSADVQEWTGMATEESDSKWLGTQIWPLETTKNKPLIERDSIGKGRTLDCGCQFRGSTECVKFHVSEGRMKKRLELRSAFYAWKFDKMGEDCSSLWTIEEEKKFRRVVRENLETSERSVWKPLCNALPQKKWVDQVSYYYNVYMLRRRGYQNRHCPSDIDSDDDETEYRFSNNSIRHATA